MRTIKCFFFFWNPQDKVGFPSSPEPEIDGERFFPQVGRMESQRFFGSSTGFGCPNSPLFPFLGPKSARRFANSSQVQFLQMAKLRFAPDGRVQHFEEYWHGRCGGRGSLWEAKFGETGLKIFEEV